MPEAHSDFRKREHVLSYEEIGRIVSTFVRLGVDHMRITGGEPMVRRGILGLFQTIGALPGLDDLSVTTNASKLAESALAMRSAGVKRLNVSLDTLNADKFR